MIQSVFFYKELTAAEVGKTGTHEIYVRLPNNFDYDSFFGNSAVANGSVMEVNFAAQDITDGGNAPISLRFVYFHQSNHEKRIPSLGPLFKSHNVQEGDIVCLESRQDGSGISYYICFYKKGTIQVNPAAIYFTQINQSPNKVFVKSCNHHPLQQIFYGAPGTGKSNTIKKLVEDARMPHIRTTFHPDSDYSTFVGAYKPVMEEMDVKVTPIVTNNGVSLQPSGTYKERRIAYKFVKQAFLKAYLAAWKKYVSSGSIGNISTNHEFDTDNGRYVINSVGIYNLTLSKEFTFPKSLVSNEWNNLWNKEIFNVPKGPQTGKSVQHAIANWINKNINDCNKDKFEEGWQKLSDTIREKGRVEVRKFDDQKSQTYIICKISDDNETLTINVEAQGKSKDTLRPKFNDVDNAKASKLEKALIEILKEYDSDFDKAWDNLKQTVDKGTSPEVKDDSDGYIVPQFLIIEEINRGNCAQIFGDIFQLLDRQENGFSEYPIEADTDIQNAIKTAFEEEKEYKLESAIDVDFAVENYTSNYDANATLSDDLQAGRVMLLPPNLYIWATMNTSDQSLFPIDSAFKRRWQWEYKPIGYKNEHWTIEIGDKKYKWVDFQREINDRIYGIDNSEDKQLGDFFVNANQTDNKISADVLLNKILFYLWNDVCKDDPEQIFRWKDDKDNNQEKSIKFSEFFCEERDRKLQGLMSFLGVQASGNNKSGEVVTPAENEDTTENDAQIENDAPTDNDIDVN